MISIPHFDIGGVLTAAASAVIAWVTALFTANRKKP